MSKRKVTIRCFLAVDLPGETKEVLAGLQRELRAAGADVRWVRPEGFHLTLKFFGSIPEGKLEELVKAAERAASGLRPFVLSLKGAGFFPPRGTPRVVWVGLSGDLDPLLELHRRLERAFERVGFPPERRPFHPHLTLGRVKTPRGAEELRRRTANLRIPEHAFRVERLTFFRSELRPDGAVYTALREVALRGEGE
ncbi:RNA 2',3'-cyclic phosphodiesterase [Thermosulfurimonas sp. F29]|uniref:RNA 2',3'-cyclic phosphodiesterase n=1 Tax=Thermosulfurimonas sp. F29 TaxID=2867247 RepID=UPI001C82A4DA|nr:RNA 2',3'-cyclic phosphodiesterase [Thermosulfurimonas sp. F29]MBX6422690.1 RNA 2',3'-cyclic phosphodiesterase [Thermosulfurimonas sp. F29]